MESCLGSVQVKLGDARARGQARRVALPRKWSALAEADGLSGVGLWRGGDAGTWEREEVKREKW